MQFFLQQRQGQLPQQEESEEAHLLAAGTTLANKHTAPATTGEATLVPDRLLQPPCILLPSTSRPYATTSGCREHRHSASRSVQETIKSHNNSNPSKPQCQQSSLLLKPLNEGCIHAGNSMRSTALTCRDYHSSREKSLCQNVFWVAWQVRSRPENSYLAMQCKSACYACILLQKHQSAGYDHTNSLKMRAQAAVLYAPTAANRLLHACYGPTPLPTALLR